MGIDYCLKNGKKLLDGANILKDAKHFTSAVPLYILAYEELNKASFLKEKLFINEDVSDKEWKNLASFGSHDKKILFDLQLQYEELKQMTDERYDQVSNWSSSQGLSLNKDRIAATEALKSNTLIIKNFNKIKKLFLYVDYQNQKWQYIGTKFSNKLLNNVCEFLDQNTCFLYYQIRFLIDMYANNLITKEDTPAVEETHLIFSNPNNKKLLEILSKQKTKRGKEIISSFIQFLNSLK